MIEQHAIVSSREKIKNNKYENNKCIMTVTLNDIIS